MLAQSRQLTEVRADIVWPAQLQIALDGALEINMSPRYEIASQFAAALDAENIFLPIVRARRALDRDGFALGPIGPPPPTKVGAQRASTLNLPSLNHESPFAAADCQIHNASWPKSSDNRSRGKLHALKYDATRVDHII